MQRQELIRRIRKAGRMLLSGRDSLYHADEFVGFDLTPLTPQKDEAAAGPRLNIIVPTLSESAAFGGLATLVDLPLQVFARGLAPEGWRLRFVNLGASPATEDDIGRKHALRHGIDADKIEAVHVCASGTPVPVGAKDIFLGSLWHSLPAALPLMRFQHETFGGGRRPYVSLVQDYEPGFHPWSSAFMLARAAYDADWPRVFVFNSSELARYYAAQGHRAAPSAVFEPVLNHELKMALTSAGPPAKERRILFYGRPEERRNCFFLARRALEIWSETYARAPQWQVASIGANHEPFPLAGAGQCEVLGKLTLSGYARELHRAGMGLSLMASPHPSYPPLEMAHFGALTVTNGFDCKDLSDWHENIRSVTPADPETLAAALSECCERFEKNPGAGREAQSRKQQYLDGHEDTALQAISDLILNAAS
jgi:hypothetical protein